MHKLIKLFNKNKINGYIIPKNDEYFNEYIHKSKDRLKFVSDFTGSAGFAIIFKNQNYLFVDGRYTIQAKRQSGKNFKIITIPNKFPKDVLKFKSRFTLGFDPKLHTENQINFLFKIKNLVLKPINLNLVDLVWQKKPKEKIKKFFYLTNKNSGRSSHKKILEFKRILVKNKSDFLFISAPENVAWILNIRGHDSKFSPTTNARLLIDKKGRLDLFTNLKKIPETNNIFD